MTERTNPGQCLTYSTSRNQDCTLTEGHAGPHSFEPPTPSPRVHCVKCWVGVFDDVRSGRKSFEYRLNDRDYQVGDVLVLQEYNPEYDSLSGRVHEVRVTYLLPGGKFGVPEKYCVMGIEPRMGQPRCEHPDEHRWSLYAKEWCQLCGALWAKTIERPDGEWLRAGGVADKPEAKIAGSVGEQTKPLTGAELAAKHGFKPHGRDPLTCGAQFGPGKPCNRRATQCAGPHAYVPEPVRRWLGQTCPERDFPDAEAVAEWRRKMLSDE